jgi:hypothetical protein
MNDGSVEEPLDGITFLHLQFPLCYGAVLTLLDERQFQPFVSQFVGLHLPTWFDTKYSEVVFVASLFVCVGQDLTGAFTVDGRLCEFDRKEPEGVTIEELTI